VFDPDSRSVSVTAGDRVQDRNDMLAPNPVAGVDVGKSFLDLDFDPAAKACGSGTTLPASRR